MASELCRRGPRPSRSRTPYMPHIVLAFRLVNTRLAVEKSVACEENKPNIRP